MNGNAPLNAFPGDYRQLLNELTTVMQDLAMTTARQAAIAVKWNALHQMLFPYGGVMPQALHEENDAYRFYTSVKRDLELINKILNDDNVHLETRRRAAINLADEIEHSCWAGMIGYIRVIAASLEACAGGLIGRLYAARVDVMNQVFAEAQAEQARRQRMGPAMNVHVNSALFNHFADRYHVARIEESYGNNQMLQSRGLDLPALQRRLDTLLAPSNLIRFIAEDCLNAVKRCLMETFPKTSPETWHDLGTFKKIESPLEQIALAYAGLGTNGSGAIPITALLDYREDDCFRAGTNVPLVQHYISLGLERQSLLDPLRQLVDSPLDPPAVLTAHIEHRDTGLWCVHEGYREILDTAHLREAHPHINPDMAGVRALQIIDPVSMQALPPSQLNHSHLLAHFLKVMGPARAAAYLNQHRHALPSAFNTTRHTWLLAAWLMPGTSTTERVAMVSTLLEAGVAPAFRALGRRRFLPRLVIGAIQQGTAHILDRIAASGITLAQMRFSRGLLPLQEAARGRHAGIFASILSVSPAHALLATDAYGKTPMHYATSGGNADYVNQMLEKLHAEPDIARQARPLVAACLLSALRHRHADVARLLAEQCPSPETLSRIPPTESSHLLKRLPQGWQNAFAPHGIGPAQRSNSGIRALRAMLTPEEFRAYVRTHRREFRKLMDPEHTDAVSRRLNSMRWVTAIRDATSESNVPYWASLQRVGATLGTLNPHELALVQAQVAADRGIASRSRRGAT